MLYLHHRSIRCHNFYVNEMDIEEGDSEEEIIAEPEDNISFSNFFTGSTLTYLQTNGWYIIILSLVLYYLWKSKLSNFVEKWKRNRENEIELAKYKKDPDLYKAREEARMAAIIRLEKNYHEQAAKMKLLAEEKEKKKREAFISKNSHLFAGRRLNDNTHHTFAGSGGQNY